MSSELLRRVPASDYLGISPATLATWATRGGGPKYVKVGKLAMYRKSDLDAWLNERTVENTGQGSKLPQVG